MVREQPFGRKVLHAVAPPPNDKFSVILSGAVLEDNLEKSKFGLLVTFCFHESIWSVTIAPINMLLSMPFIISLA